MVQYEKDNKRQNVKRKSMQEAPQAQAPQTQPPKRLEDFFKERAVEASRPVAERVEDLIQAHFKKDRQEEEEEKEKGKKKKPTSLYLVPSKLPSKIWLVHETTQEITHEWKVDYESEALFTAVTAVVHQHLEKSLPIQEVRRVSGQYLGGNVHDKDIGYYGVVHYFVCKCQSRPHHYKPEYVLFMSSLPPVDLKLSGLPVRKFTDWVSANVLRKMLPEAVKCEDFIKKQV
jgi:hypothetical protein